MYLAFLLSAAALLVCIVSVIYLKSHIKSKTSLQFLQNEILKDIREEVNSILSAIDEATERDISLIEERERSMKKLLDDIDRRMKVYVREMEQQRNSVRILSSLSSPISAENSETDPAFPLPEFIVKAEQTGQGAEQGEPSQESPPEPQKPANSAEQVRELLRSGFSPSVVAARLEISIAEVELVAALYERQPVYQ